MAKKMKSLKHHTHGYPRASLRDSSFYFPILLITRTIAYIAHNQSGLTRWLLENPTSLKPISTKLSWWHYTDVSRKIVSSLSDCSKTYHLGKKDLTLQSMLLTFVYHPMSDTLLYCCTFAPICMLHMVPLLCCLLFLSFNFSSFLIFSFFLSIPACF